tara:strand:+ start:2710 stop:4278 length:1569 start_codon:yes stop_codon:yes gene_type:complete
MATLAQSTDVLVIGDTYFEEEARKYTERAELNGTIVINEVQFEDLLEHGHLHIEEKASPIGESIELTESIAHIRSLLGDAPTVETWQQLYQVLDKTPKSNLPDVVEYVLAHFSQHTPNWSDAGSFNREDKRSYTPPFEPPNHWLQELFTGKYSPKHRILKKINLFDLNLTGKPTNTLFASPDLRHITQINLGNNKKLPKGFYKMLGQWEGISQVTHLSLEGNPLTKPFVEGLVGSHCFPALKYLSLRECSFRDRGLMAHMLANEGLKNLEELDLSRAYGSAYTLVEPLSSAEHLTSLHTLRLHSAGFLTNERIEQLLGSPFVPQLRLLDISHYTSAEGLGRSFRHHPPFKSLRQLNLRKTDIHEEDIQDIASNPSLSSLRSLQIGDSGAPVEAFNALLQSPNLSSIQTLNMHAQFADRTEILTMLCESIQQTQLTHLSIVPQWRSEEEYEGPTFEEYYIKNGMTFTDDLIESFAYTPHFTSLEQCYLGFLTETQLDIINASPYLSDTVKHSIQHNTYRVFQS